MGKKPQRHEINIDVRELCILFFREAPLIAGVALLFALSAGLVSRFVMTPRYRSSTELYILEKESTAVVTYSDLELGTKLTKDYEELIQDRLVLEEVIHRLGLNVKYETLLKKVSVESPQDTRIIKLSVLDDSPVSAMRTANMIRDVAAAHIRAVTDIEAISVVTTANLPVAKAMPSVRSNAVTAGILGGLLTASLLLAFYFLDDTVKTSDDIRKYLDCAALAVIPRTDETSAQEAFYRAEAFKTLRTNLKFLGQEAKVIGITSCVPDEGKSSVSFGLAEALAEDGKRVTLLDTDLRRSVLRRKLPGKKEFGLSHYLSGQASLQEILLPARQENMQVILSGPVPPNPNELLGSEAFRALLQTLREMNDYVIVDTAPAGIVADGMLAAKACDEIVLVAAAGEISWTRLQAVKEQMTALGIRVLGVVLNKAEEEFGGAYGKYGKYGKYGGYGAYSGYGYGAPAKKEGAQ